MESLPPIPTPIAQRWREFRIRTLPLIFFTCVLLTIAVLWHGYVQPASIVGEVEVVTNRVASLFDGHLLELRVDRFDPVTAGQVLGVVSIKDPLLHQAMLDQAAADLKLMKLRIDLDKTRNLDSFSRLRVDLLTEQLNLAMAKTRQVQVEGEFQRAEKLFKDKLIASGASAERNDFGYDVALRDQDSVRLEVAQLMKKVAELEKNVAEMQTEGVVQIAPVDPTIEQTIKAQQEVLRQLDKPVLLTAPSDGVVREIYRRPGEKVVRGEEILAISASPSNRRIVGYLRQPIGSVPTTNDTAVVYSRGQRRQSASAQILRVGAQMEAINPLLLSPDGRRLEVGLPILVAMPAKLRLIPGEFVDIAIQNPAIKPIR